MDARPYAWMCADYYTNSVEEFFETDADGTQRMRKAPVEPQTIEHRK